MQTVAADQDACLVCRASGFDALTSARTDSGLVDAPGSKRAPDLHGESSGLANQLIEAFQV